MGIKLNHKYYLKELESFVENKGASLTISKEDKKLIFNFEVEDDSIYSPYTKDNEDIYNGDVVEVFVSFNGDIHNYLEYEISPFGIKFLGLINNPTLDKGVLTKIDPNFIGEASLTSIGYKAKIVVDLKEHDIKDIKFNAFAIDSDSNRPQKLYCLNPTEKRNFHRPNYFVMFE